MSRQLLGRITPAARSFVSRRKRIAAFVEQLMYRFPVVEDAVVALIRGDAQTRYDRWVAAYDTLDDDNTSLIRRELASLSRSPPFSIVVAVADEHAGTTDAVERSLRAQVYEHWDMNVVHASDPRAWNAALRGATCDYAVIVDARVVLRPHALLLFARTVAAFPDALIVYGDEDEIDAGGHRSRHNFKPDWNPALLRSQNYLGGAVCVRRADALAIGGAEAELDGDCAWGLLLRLTAHAPRERIHHLPFVVSHRLREVRSAPPNRQRVARAVEARLGRTGERVEVEPVGETGYRTRYSLPDSPPLVSIVVPTSCKLDVLRPCVGGLLNRTSYPAYELIIVVNGADALGLEQRRFLQALEESPHARVMFHEERPYSFAATNNWAAEQAAGDVLCFLNDDTEPIGSDWLSAMVAEVLQDRVAAAGALLLYPNGRIQHAGVILGVGGVAAHAYRGKPRDTRGYHDRALVSQDVSCVTAACMVVRRDVFSSVGGFDPALAIAFNDVDLCLRLRQAGWRIVWTPAAELYHKESASIGRHNLTMGDQWTAEYELIRGRWIDQLLADPHYSPNLPLDGLEIWEPAFPPRVPYPWRAAAVEGPRQAATAGPSVGRTRPC